MGLGPQETGWVLPFLMSFSDVYANLHHALRVSYILIH